MALNDVYKRILCFVAGAWIEYANNPMKPYYWLMLLTTKYLSYKKNINNHALLIVSYFVR